MARAGTKPNNRRFWTAVTSAATAPAPVGDSGQHSATGTTAKSVRLPGGKFDRGTVIISATCGGTTSTAMTITPKLWGYVEALDSWAPLGTSSTAADRGKLNNASAIGEDATDSISYAELVEGLATFDQLYLEMDAIAGASISADAWLVLRKR